MSSRPRAPPGLSLGAPSRPHAEDVAGPSREAAEGIEEIDTKIVMPTFLKRGDRVDVVYEDHVDPQIQKLEASLGLVNKEIRVSHTCVSMCSILAVFCNLFYGRT